ncbi:LCP family protein [Patulibacter americanus]|uniref:LCP family protein n=1 Tax=Patulibacter americanus TaxID=588672 RepID=UPI0012FB1797|nr:LCP family protein [Patulibacter americanus]
MTLPGRSPLPRPGRHMAARLLLSGLLVVVLSASAVAGAMTWLAGESTKKLRTFRPHEAPVLDKEPAGRPQTILLTGLDHRYGQGKGIPDRSDTMILLRLDPDAKATTILSLPRDLRVAIPGHGDAPQKLNAAWAHGGARVLTRTLRTSLLGTRARPFRINEVVSVRFDAFAQAVNHFGCLYTDVDRRYLVPSGAGYAEIDQLAGYQLLCGQDALAYVRSRHADNSVVREARQSTYLSEARGQIDVGGELTRSGGLLDAVGKYVTTNVSGGRELLGIARLAVNVTDKPTKQVVLRTTLATDGSGDVLTTPAALARARREFLRPKAVRRPKPPAAKPKGARRAGGSSRRPRRGTRAATPLPATMTRDAAGANVAAAAVRAQAGRVPVLVPAARPSRGGWVPDMSRGYTILSKDRRPRWAAYRIVGSTDRIGEYYGVEGTAWKDPPILKLVDDAVRLAGRTWRVQYDGAKVRRLLWRAPTGTYWITNTLTNDLSAREMYALARTFGPATAAG